MQNDVSPKSNQRITAIDDEIGGYKEASKWLGIPISTLYSEVSLKKIPHFRLSKRQVRFSKNELMAWLQAHSVPVRPTQTDRRTP
jgi:excisionase family DNA binding protein